MLSKHYNRDSIDPDEIFLDASNLPDHDPNQFEGRVERPVSTQAFLALVFLFITVACGFAYRAYSISVSDGEKYAEISRNNRLDRSVLFATRGRILDKNERELAWNDLNASSTASTTFTLRKYTSLPGLSHVLGFVRYPKSDAKGEWWREEYTPVSGVEYFYDSVLHGINGSSMTETSASGKVVRTNITTEPINGTDLHLTIDAEVQSKLYETLLHHANEQHFVGGAGVIMDIHTGNILALTSIPEYSNAAFVEGNSDAIDAAHESVRSPTLNRAVAGAYTPGSIVKPLFAAAALEEEIISPEKQIYSSGALILPNPYNPDQPSIFKDWRAHGWVDMRHAIAQSSDEYFYTVGGGYKSQKGLGINKIDEYSKRFGFATITGVMLGGEIPGIIPTPEWKEKVFGANDPWRIGNTYHTAIGQFGFQVTPLQVVRAIAALANGGTLYEPHLIKGERPTVQGTVGITESHLQVAREGMRLAVTLPDYGTARSLNMPEPHIAAKTGTAQTGTHNQWMNSWVVGFWPYEKPRYAFAIMLEKAPAGTLSGAAPGMKPFFEWLVAYKPEYIASE
ncbi:hypothetical protein EBR66_03095 [bacterium]|nr:hypothetical protein [bacterium]